MKKLIAMAVAILLTACITAFAAGKEPGAMPAKKIDYHLSFSKIVIYNDIDLQLIESNEKTIDISGDDADVQKVDWKISKDVLYIKSKKGSLKDRVKISITVSQLQEILIYGKSAVSSAGTLLSPSLYIFIDDDSYIDIKNMGGIRIANSNDTELDIRKIVGNVQLGK